MHQLKQRIDNLDKYIESLGENTDIQSLINKKRLMEQEITKAALVPEILKKRQKEYAQIVDQIESYKAILGNI
jgi:myo-inositol-1-phosphate synthase